MRIAVLLLLVAACSEKTATQSGLAPPPTEIMRTMVTTVPHVKLRETASADAAKMNEIPIAQRVLELEPARGEWEHVSTRKMQRGYVLATEVRPLDNDHPEETYLAIWRERFAKAKLDFDERAALVDALQVVEDESHDTERRAMVSLARILTLKAALAMIDATNAAKPPYKEFLEQHRDTVAYDEPEREWNPLVTKLWSSALAYKATPSGEAVAWEAAATPLPGDCEGDFACSIDLVNQTAGKYLALFPEGRSAPLALKRYSVLGTPARNTLDAASVKDIRESIEKAESILAKCHGEARKPAEAALVRVRTALDDYERGREAGDDRAVDDEMATDAAEPGD